MSSDGLKYIPNAFYDMMVFVVPSVQFIVGTMIGFNSFDIRRITNVSAESIIALTVLIMVFSYEYGRIAEALSAYVVQSPLKWLNKRGIIFRNQDFLKEREEIYKILGLTDCYDGRKGDKWAIYLYAFTKNTLIGSDLLKRYAWEKLSRNSAFTYFVLFLLSLIVIVIRYAPIHVDVFNDVSFGTILYTVTCFLLCIFTYIEYYRRNCWNYDLLTKSLPILINKE